MPTMNWQEMAQADDEANKPAPSGVYVIAVTKATWGKSKAGAPQIILVMKVDEGPYKGKTVWNYLTFDPENGGAIRMARQFLKMCGKDFGDFGQLTEQQQLDFLVGKRFEADLKVDNFQGRDGNKIKNLIKGLDGSMATGVTPPPPMPDSATPPPVNPLAGV